jgi:parvulin-like peptidyl-prolyl isomerase
MKSSRIFLSAVLCAGFAYAQGTSSPTSHGQAQPPSNASNSTQLKPRGPEDIAQQDPNRVVATIDGKQITAKQAMDLLKPFTPDQRKQLEANLTLGLQRVYMQQQFAQQAEKMNLDQQSPFREELQNTRQQILAQAYMQKLGEGASGTAGDAKQYYDTHPAEFDTVKLSGIFVSFTAPGTPSSAASNEARTEEQAKERANDIEKKIKDGGDFATLARTESDNKQTAASGGNLGSYTTSNPGIPPDIKAAIEKLQPGQVSEPIRVSSAYLIIKVDSKNKLSFEQAKPGIVQKLEVEKYKVQVQDPDFFASSSAPSSHIPSLQRPATSPGPGQPAQPATKPPAQR